MTETRTENRVYLEGLIREFEQKGFKVGLTVQRDGFTRHLWFRGGFKDFWDFPLDKPAQQAAEDDADRIYNAHIEVLNP